ncbi:MAG: hypothetical protein J6Q82_08070 [Clostridia bacterium]|nr:hypothetical protein [Clostridia bacterium]
MKQIISREIPILPSMSHSLSNYVGTLQAFSNFKERLEYADYTCFSRNLLEAEKSFFTRKYYYTK